MLNSKLFFTDDDDPDYVEEELSEDDEEWDEEEVVEKEEELQTKKKIFKTKRERSAKYNMKLSIEDPYKFDEDDNSNEHLEEDDGHPLVTQTTSNKNGDRKWDKLNACPYCKFIGTGKLDLHLEAKHKDEEDVKLLLKYKKIPKVKGEDEKIPNVKGKEKKKSEAEIKKNGT